MSLSRITSASIANSAISAADIADGTITAAKIISVANTQITGNIVSSQIAPSIVLTTPALGTPASGVLTNCTGLPTAALPAGSVLQVVNSQTGALATTTTTTPIDDTIPQITEGAQFLSLAITPISATSKLLFEIVLMVSTSGANSTIVALFQGATANAIAAAMTNSGSTLNTTAALNYFMTSGTTSSTTFTVRAGPGAGTLTVNGNGGSRFLGGVLYSSITITEIAA